MDLEIKDVAELLNLSEETIKEWLSQGKIPAYQINETYRFSRSEIEDWLMQEREGLPSEAHGELGTHQYSLYRALNRGDVFTLPGKSKESLFQSAMEKMALKFDLDADVLTELFLDREQMMPTALGHGIAVPHTRDFLLETHFDAMLIVYPEEALEYGALDGERVHTLFFLFACEDAHHLNLLAKVAHFGRSSEMRELLKRRPGKAELLKVIKNFESAL